MTKGSAPSPREKRRGASVAALRLAFGYAEKAWMRFRPTMQASQMMTITTV